MIYNILFSCITHKGNCRSINQDNFICDGQCIEYDTLEIKSLLKGKVASKKPSLFGVFDGMGGEECGEIASYIAAKEALATTYNKNSVLTFEDICKRANEKICTYARENKISTMGTTAAMLLFTKKEITLCNIGDSKVFRFSNNKLEQISKDHIVISAYGTKPPLSQNLGIPPEQSLIEPYLSQGIYKNGDKFLICSDGLTDMLTNDEIKELLKNCRIEDATLGLLNRALEHGGKDNVTVILLEVNQVKNKFINIFNKIRRRNYDMQKLWN